MSMMVVWTTTTPSPTGILPPHGGAPRPPTIGLKPEFIT